MNCFAVGNCGALSENDSNDEVEVPIDAFCGKRGPGIDDSDLEATDSDSENSHAGRDNDTDSGDAAENNWCNHGVSMVKQIYSGALLVFSIVVVGAAIFQKQTIATGEWGLSSTAAFIIFWILLLYLAQLEGGLNNMVGLKPVNPKLYTHSHPLTYGCTKLVHKGDNLDRFIVGRQYLDLTMVFTTSYMVSAIDNASIMGLPQAISSIFLNLGLAVILVTIVIGQLVAVINSSKCMLDFVNNYVMLVSTYLALLVEASGILHAVYFIQIVVRWLTGKADSEAEPKKSAFQKFTFWLRVAFSVSLLLFSMALTVKALFDGDTTMWQGVPAYASIILLVVLILTAGIMESLQIASMAVVHIPEDEIEHHPVAKKNCEIIFGKKNRFQAFLIGRQICQTVIMFLIARIITLNVKVGDNIWGVSDGFQTFLNSGVLATLFATIIASLSWRVLANTFPVAFLACPLSRPIICLCLATEATGVCSVAWSLAKLHRTIARFHKDEYYIGSLEERANNKDLDVTNRISVEGSETEIAQEQV